MGGGALRQTFYETGIQRTFWVDCNLDIKKPHEKFGFHSDEIEKDPQYVEQITKGRTVKQSPPVSLKRLML